MHLIEREVQWCSLYVSSYLLSHLHLPINGLVLTDLWLPCLFTSLPPLPSSSLVHTYVYRHRTVVGTAGGYI